MNTSNTTTRVSKNSDFLAKIKTSDIFLRAKEIKNLPLIIAIILLAVCLLVFCSKTDTTDTVASNSDELEIRLAETLSSIDGAGEVKCMIYRGSAEQNDPFFKNKSESGEIVGVIIVAEGAKDISVMLKLKDATVTALSVDPSKVQVYKKQNK